MNCCDCPLFPLYFTIHFFCSRNCNHWKLFDYRRNLHEWSSFTAPTTILHLISAFLIAFIMFPEIPFCLLPAQQKFRSFRSCPTMSSMIAHSQAHAASLSVPWPFIILFPVQLCHSAIVTLLCVDLLTSFVPTILFQRRHLCFAPSLSPCFSIRD